MFEIWTTQKKDDIAFTMHPHGKISDCR